MQHKLPISNDPNVNYPRTDEVQGWNWRFKEEKIIVDNTIYYTKPDDSYCSVPNPFNKTLTVDDTDFINLDNGQLVLGEEYRANPSAYPNVAGQYTVMMATSIEDYMEMLFPGVKAKLISAGISEFKTPLSQLLLGVTDMNIIISDQKGKFNS